MSDLISRQGAIDALKTDTHYIMFDEWGNFTADGLQLMEIVTGLPSAQPEQHLDEWCHDCKEYDQEKHCCPRFNRVIREALKDAQPEIIRCKDCKHYVDGFIHCNRVTWYNSKDDYCSRAERKNNE